MTRRVLTRGTFLEPADCLSITPEPGGAFYPGRRALGPATDTPPSLLPSRTDARKKEKKRKPQWRLITSGNQSQLRWLVVPPSFSSSSSSSSTTTTTTPTSDDANRDRTLSLGMDGAMMLLIWSLQGNKMTARNGKNKIKIIRDIYPNEDERKWSGRGGR